MSADWYQDTEKESHLFIDFLQESPNRGPCFQPIMVKTHFRESSMRRIAPLVLLFFLVFSLLCFGETFLIVVKEIRDGEELSRPFASQEGMIADLEPELKIDTFVNYYLLDVETFGILGEGEMVLDNRSPEKQQFTYWQFLFSVGQDVAAQGIELLKRITPIR